jgi:hypothetical protein
VLDFSLDLAVRSIVEYVESRMHVKSGAKNRQGPATLLIDFAIMGVMIFNVGKLALRAFRWG